LRRRHPYHPRLVIDQGCGRAAGGGASGIAAHRIVSGCEGSAPAQALEALCAAARAGRLVVACGAGLSREFPALAPIVGASRPLPGLLELLRQAVLEPLPLDLKAAAAVELPAMGLEQFLESVAAVVGDEALEFLDLLEAPASRPNFRHLAIARLAARGCLRAIVTVNFDTFLEQALEQLGVPYVVPEEAGDEARAYRELFGRSGRLPLLKLHGTLRHRASLLTTIETVGLGLPRYKAGGLRLAVESGDLLVAGYSDNDVDVFREVKRAELRGSVFWHLLAAPAPEQPELARIASLLVGHRHQVLSGSLDELLAAVAERLDPGATSAVLAGLGVADLAAIAAAEAREAPGRAEELRRRASRLAASWLTPAASALIVRRCLHEDTREQAELRRRLLELVERVPAPGARVAIARCNQVAEELAHRGERSAAIRLRRRLLAEHGGGDDRRLAAPLLEEKIRLIGHELAQRRHRARAIVRILEVRRELRRRGDLPARDRARLRSILGVRFPASLHRLVQRLLGWELRLRCGGGRWRRRLAALVRWLRRRLAGVAERRFRRVVDAEFGAGFRGLAMQRVAELLLLRREAWTPEVDELLAAARWRTRPDWRLEDAADEAQYLGIPDGVRLLYLGDLPRAREHLIRTFRYYAQRRDISGRVQCLLYLGAVYVGLGWLEAARAALGCMGRIRGGYR
jgi:phosphoserine phosphatase